MIVDPDCGLNNEQGKMNQRCKNPPDLIKKNQSLIVSK